MQEMEIGIVTHYFGHLQVAAIMMTGGELGVGDTVRFKGHTSDFTSTVGAIQIEHNDVPRAVAGDAIGIKVAGHAREHDKVYKVIP